MEKNAGMVKLASLTKKKDKNGQTILVGSLNKFTQLLVLPNMRKELATDADYSIYIRSSQDFGKPSGDFDHRDVEDNRGNLK